jgi:cell division protein FtsQ
MKMKLEFKKIKEYGIASFGLAVVLSLIAFVNEKTKIQRCQGIEVTLINGSDQFYISKEDIAKYVTRNGIDPLEGKILSEIDLSSLEERVQEINQIEYCEAFGDLKGIIHLKVKPFVPYARLSFGNSKRDKYLNDEGYFFPLSKYHSARVLLLSGNYFNGKKALETEKDLKILGLIHAIKNNEFWNAQIAQMDINRAGEITFVPVLGDQIIEFGTADNIDSKLNKLKVYYKQIMAVKGWDQFSKVKVQYANQVVCE